MLTRLERSMVVRQGTVSQLPRTERMFSTESLVSPLPISLFFPSLTLGSTGFPLQAQAPLSPLNPLGFGPISGRQEAP
jgi:hypothetical protein